MRVALVHYHLRTGGVTRVIRDQVDALRGAAETMVIAGEMPREPLPCPTARVAALAYDRDLGQPADPAATAREIVAAARAVWPAGASLYHFHNPTLGKNLGLGAVIRGLQDLGEALLLQIHDFAEDGRPELYTGEPYPEDCHYAVINRRDLAALRAAGLADEGLHYLPNAVRPLPLQSGAGAGRLFLYPVRAIRRKNLGEAILLSRFLPAGCEVGVTLEPTGPLDLRSYEGWKAYAAERSLPVRFGLGADSRLDHLLAASRSVITTSIKEGFGFAFLEPWTAGLALHGRFLAETCPDFEEAGMHLAHLYRGVRIPISWIDARALERKLRLCREAGRTAYGTARTATQTAVAADLPPGPDVDFGDLSEDLQSQAIDLLLDSARNRTLFLDANPRLAAPLRAGLQRDLIEANRAAVLERFSLEATRARLLEVYRRATGEQVRHAIDKDILVRELGAREGSLLLCPRSYD